MLAGVELSVWAIQISVRPCSTHWRISSRYGLSVAFCVGTAGSISAAAEAAARGPGRETEPSLMLISC